MRLFRHHYSDSRFDCRDSEYVGFQHRRFGKLDHRPDWWSELYNRSQYGQFCGLGVHSYGATWDWQHECRQWRQHRGFERLESEQYNDTESARRELEQRNRSK